MAGSCSQVPAPDASGLLPSSWSHVTCAPRLPRLQRLRPQTQRRFSSLQMRRGDLGLKFVTLPKLRYPNMASSSLVCPYNCTIQFTEKKESEKPSSSVSLTTFQKLNTHRGLGLPILGSSGVEYFHPHRRSQSAVLFHFLPTGGWCKRDALLHVNYFLQF